jgi:hypothetical protein
MTNSVTRSTAGPEKPTYPSPVDLGLERSQRFLRSGSAQAPECVSLQDRRRQKEVAMTCMPAIVSAEKWPADRDEVLVVEKQADSRPRPTYRQVWD